MRHTEYIYDQRSVTADFCLSSYSEGNDGPWSTFDLRVGAPAQYLRVLVSTASPESMVVVPLGCTAAAFGSTTAPQDCTDSRGGLFNPNQSSTWHDEGQFGINANGIGLEANLGYSVTQEVGLDTVGVGLTGPNVTNSTVGTFATTEPFYLYVDARKHGYGAYADAVGVVGVSLVSTTSRSTSALWATHRRRLSSQV
jgi:hypothetical protein